MSNARRQFKLGAFIMATGHHIAAWRHPHADADAGHNIDHYRGLAQTAERGLFDLVFVADSPAGWDGDRDAEIRSRVSHSAHFEPVTLWAALSQVTEHIGFVATASTTYEDPYLLARKFASLDHISKGRAAWNVVTTGGRRQQEFLDPRPSRRTPTATSGPRSSSISCSTCGTATRTTRWSPTRRAASSSIPSKVHAHQPPAARCSRSPGRSTWRARRRAGRWWCRPARPSPGRELAARTAEVIFTANQTLADAQAFYADLKARLPTLRPPRRGAGDHAGHLPGARRHRGGGAGQLRVHPVAGAPGRSPGRSSSNIMSGVDLSGYSLDDKAPPLPAHTELNQSRLKLVADLRRAA